MSSNSPETAERKGTPPVTRKDPDAPLTPYEKKCLWKLGYKVSHLKNVEPVTARQFIATKRYRPGSAAFNKHQPPEMRVNPKHTDEGIEKSNKGKAAPSGVRIQVDEFTNACIRGENPLDAVLLEAAAAHPDMHFRLINPDLNSLAGPQYQTAYEEVDGKKRAIQIGGLTLGYMPKSVYHEFYVLPNIKRSQDLMGEVTKVDKDLVIPSEEAHLAAIEGQGLHVEGNFNIH